MTALQYAINTRPTMGPASEQLVREFEDGKLRFHHDALVTGYTSVKGQEFASYNGRFGRGIAVFTNYNTRYSKVSYYIY